MWLIWTKAMAPYRSMNMSGFLFTLSNLGSNKQISLKFIWLTTNKIQIEVEIGGYVSLLTEALIEV